MIKSRISSTRNRPEGSRSIDSSYVAHDLFSLTRQLIEERAWQHNERNGITLFKSDYYTVVLTSLKAGATIGDKRGHAVCTVQVLGGKINAGIGREQVDLYPQDLIHFHEEAGYSVLALQDSLLLLIRSR